MSGRCHSDDDRTKKGDRFCIGHTGTVLTAREHVSVDLEKYGHPDVVFGHHSVQHDLRALRVGHGHLVELHSVFLNQSIPARMTTHLEILEVILDKSTCAHKE